MNRILFTLLILLASASQMRAADGDLFPYPKPPADMELLQDRCDYLVGHFWDRVDFKSAMSKRDALNSTFGDWVSFMPYATADTVHAATARLLDKVKKSGQYTLVVAQLAEAWTYSDTTDIFSEEIYYPFAKAASENKKISAADRARFESHVRIIDNSCLGGRVEHLNYVTTDEQKGSIDDVHTQAIVVMFNHYDCSDCSMARVRLNADYNTNALIKAGLLTVMSIEPEEPTTEWLVEAASYPKEWIVGASADADEWFDLRYSPTFLLLDSRHKVLAKDFDIDGLLAALARLKAHAGI